MFSDSIFCYLSFLHEFFEISHEGGFTDSRKILSHPRIGNLSSLRDIFENSLEVRIFYHSFGYYQ